MSRSKVNIEHGTQDDAFEERNTKSPGEKEGLVEKNEKPYVVWRLLVSLNIISKKGRNKEIPYKEGHVKDIESAKGIQSFRE